MSHQPTFRKPTEGRSVAVVGDVYRFLATGADTGGKYALWEAIITPGGGPPPHVHSREGRLLRLEGEIAFFIGDQRLVATTGMFVADPNAPRRKPDNGGQELTLDLFSGTMPSQTFRRAGTPRRSVNGCNRWKSRPSRTGLLPGPTDGSDSFAATGTAAPEPRTSGFPAPDTVARLDHADAFSCPCGEGR